MKTTKCNVCVLSLFMASLLFTGCKISDEQVKVIAQNAGLASCITWIAYDNPNAEAKTLLSEIMEVVQTNVYAVQSGKTYMEVIYPLVEDFARSNRIPDQYEALVLAGAMSSLNGLDLLFITNPSWKDKGELAVDIVKSFVFGVKMGLRLDDNDPLIIQANVLNSKRARNFQR